MTTRKVLVVALADDLDTLGELSGILGLSYEVMLLRDVDRQKLSMALDGRTQYDAVHIIAHGGSSAVVAADGLVSESEMVTLIESQRGLQFVVVASCDSYGLVGGIHNALHVPCIGYDAPVDDRAAVEFSRAFYQTLRSMGGRRRDDVGFAVARARESLAVLYPSEALKVRLINGDMVTPAAFGACMGRIDERLDSLGVEVVGINRRLDRMEGSPRRWVYAGLCLGILLLVAELGTPFLNAALARAGS